MSVASAHATHVIAVGISTYAIGQSWRLASAADSALEFSRWANACGVPAENIHLFIGSDYPKITSAAKSVGFHTRTATSSSFRRFIAGELQALRGEVLYIFWSGHGVLIDGNQRVLLFQDFSMTSHPNLDLMRFVRQLRAAPYANFKKQIFYIDASAGSADEIGLSSMGAAADLSPIRPPMPGVEQDLLFAADAGEETIAGWFSRELLFALKQQCKASTEWPPNPDVIRRNVLRQFEGKFQRPVQVAWRSHSGDEEVISEPSANSDRGRTSRQSPPSTRGLDASAVPLRIFVSYAHADERSRERLEKQIAVLKRRWSLVTWSDRKILPGQEYAREIDEQLIKADLILLLVSPDFMASEYIVSIELRTALSRHASGAAIVVPIILRPIGWEWDLGKLQALPKDAKPVANWSKPDNAWHDIELGIHRLVERIARDKSATL